jgi:hypothetical protein
MESSLARAAVLCRWSWCTPALMWLVEQAAQRAGLSVVIYWVAEWAWRAFELITAEQNCSAVGASMVLVETKRAASAAWQGQVVQEISR